MTSFTYDLDNDIGKVRFEIGDTDEDNAQFTDDEIQVKIDDTTDNLAAAAALCDVLATRYSLRFDFSVDGQVIKGSQIAKAYSERAEALRLRSSDSVGTFFVSRQDAYTQDIPNDSAERSRPQTDPLGNGNDFDAGRLWA